MNYEFKNDKPMLLPIYIILFLAALTLLYYAQNDYTKAMHLLKTGINTEAIVTEIKENNDGDGTSYTPIFTFQDLQGNKISFANPVSTSTVVWKKGEPVSIVYDPAVPSFAKVVSYWGLFRWTIILLTTAVPLLIISLGYFAFLTFAVQS